MKQGNNDTRSIPEEIPAWGPTTTTEEKMPKSKILGLDEPYEHAPPKPADPWAVLLKPELEADKIRCTAWMEEVQNLLIFAGLFSAVVTAFVIESYKFLQPNPNDTIINLLSQIANGPNGNLSAGTSILTATSVQASSSIRINVFWFISLILSLATVLVGTIALQWLREHQSYLHLSPKEALPILRMRTLGLEAWYVPQLFTALPLLLQGALVLFFAGLIDFTLPLGAKLAIPVACIIVVILLFLGVTTVLPAFQAVFLPSGRISRETVPTPCAFKSPQSQVFRTLSGFFLHLLSSIFPTLYPLEPGNQNNIPSEDSKKRHLFPHIYTIWHPKTWPTYDLEWLSLRDAWHQGILDKYPYLFEHRDWWTNEFPLSDVTQCLVQAINGPTSAKHTDEYLASACQCFEQVSASVFPGPGYQSHLMRSYHAKVDRRNNYLEQLITLEDTEDSRGSIARFLIHGGDMYQYKFSDDEEYPIHCYSEEHRALFHQDQISLFLDRIISKHASPALRRYQREMKLRLLQYLVKANLQPLQPIGRFVDDFFHTVLRLIDNRKYRDAEDNPSGPVDLLTAIFESIASSQIKQEDLTNPIYTNAEIDSALTSMAEALCSHIREQQWHTSIVNSNASNHLYHPDIGEKYSSTFRSVAKHLNDEISNYPRTSPSLLFYSSAILLRHFLYGIGDDSDQFSQTKGSSFVQGLSVLLDTVFRYKQRTGGRNEEIETMFKGEDSQDWISNEFGEQRQAERFSGEWWAAFFRKYDKSGLRITRNDPTVPSSTPPNIAHLPPTSADETQPPTPDIAPPAPDIADNVASSPTSTLDVAPISDPTLDTTPPGQLGHDPAGTDPQPSSSSSPSRSPTVSDVAIEPFIESPAQIATSQVCGSEYMVDGNGPPRNLPTPGDIVLDMQPPGVLEESENRTSADETRPRTRDIAPSSPAGIADNIISSPTSNLDALSIPNPTLDGIPLGEVDEHAHVASPQPSASSSLEIFPTSSDVANEPSIEPPSQVATSQVFTSEPLVDGLNPLRSPAIPGDSVIDMQPPGVQDESEIDRWTERTYGSDCLLSLSGERAARD